MKRVNDFEETKFERAVFEVFQESPDGGAFGAFDDLSRRRMINDILDTADLNPHVEHMETRTSRGGMRFIMAGAAAAFVSFCVFGVLFWMILGSPSKTKLPRETYFGEVQSVDGSLYFDRESAFINAPIPVGRSLRTEDGGALLRLPTGIEWRMEERAEARIDSLDRNKLKVSVMSGECWFRVDPTREGPAFSVDTSMGRIEVTGTVFMVRAEPEDVRVTLLKGEVWVTHSSGRRNLVRAGHTFHLKDGKQFALTSEVRTRMGDRMTALDWDSLPDTTPSTEADVEDQEHPQASAAPLTEAADRVTPGRLLEEIQGHRKQGDWQRVVSLYTRLIRSAPGSETAVVSRVSLGEIYLTKLHRYDVALVQFDKYLRSGHKALQPEALYGKCNTLKAMGKREQEMKCLERFVRRFKRAFQVPDARARLDALRGRRSI